MTTESGMGIDPKDNECTGDFGCPHCGEHFLREHGPVEPTRFEQLYAEAAPGIHVRRDKPGEPQEPCKHLFRSAVSVNICGACGVFLGNVAAPAVPQEKREPRCESCKGTKDECLANEYCQNHRIWSSKAHPPEGDSQPERHSHWRCCREVMSLKEVLARARGWLDAKTPEDVVRAVDEALASERKTMPIRDCDLMINEGMSHCGHMSVSVPCCQCGNVYGVKTSDILSATDDAKTRVLSVWPMAWEHPESGTIWTSQSSDGRMGGYLGSSWKEASYLPSTRPCICGDAYARHEGETGGMCMDCRDCLEFRDAMSST